MKIAILGWGSLLWDIDSEFDEHHDAEWPHDGPLLPLEFCRISSSRKDALTLVIDTDHGKLCRVAYTFSNREYPKDAICDLCKREGVHSYHKEAECKKIGFCFADEEKKCRSRDTGVKETIREWARENGIDVVVWTDLESNFETVKGRSFTVEAAIDHLHTLSPEGKDKAAEYVWRAPDFIKTDLRSKLEKDPWFIEA